MAARGLEEAVGGAPGRVDAAVAGGDPAQLRLQFTDPHLVAPVGALLVVPLGVGEVDVPGGVTHSGIVERGGECCECAGLPGRVGVAEGHDLTPGALDRGVLGRHLAAPR